jgi:hypothetical protein
MINRTYYSNYLVTFSFFVNFIFHAKNANFNCFIGSFWDSKDLPSSALEDDPCDILRDIMSCYVCHVCHVSHVCHAMPCHHVPVWSNSGGGLTTISRNDDSSAGAIAIASTS